MSDLRPAQATKTLRDNAVSLQQLGDELETAYVELALSRASFLDAENKAHQEYFAGKTDIMVSALDKWIKTQTYEERKANELADLNVKKLRSRYEILKEVNDALKFSFRIVEMTSKNMF